jgi:hypothetical protein
MKKILILIVALVLLLGLPAAPVMAGGGGGGINNPPGNLLYVIIEVTWDGTLTDADNDGNHDSSTWTVWGPKWDPVVGTGTILTSATDCFDMSYYNFTFHGKTVHFDEIYVEGVDASPQVHHVVLKDVDGDGTYTGSDPASKYTFPSRPGELYHDRIDYWITFDETGSVTNFRYLEYEHRKM